MKKKIYTLIAMALCSTMPPVFGQQSESRVELFGNDHFVTTKKGDEFKMILDKEPGESVTILLRPSRFENGKAIVVIESSKFANIRLCKYDENAISAKEVVLETFQATGEPKEISLNLDELGNSQRDSIMLSMYVEPQNKWQGKISLRISADNESAAETTPFKIYPNPASEQITIQCSQKGVGILRIFDEMGLLKLQKTDIENGKKTNVSTSMLRSGNYKVVYSTNNKSYSSKLTVINK